MFELDGVNGNDVVYWIYGTNTRRSHNTILSVLENLGPRTLDILGTWDLGLVLKSGT